MLTDDDLSQCRIEEFMHCKMCVEECPPDVSPQDWARISFGLFHKVKDPGLYLQLWCNRHDCNITTIYVATDEWEHDDRLPLRVKGANNVD